MRHAIYILAFAICFVFITDTAFAQGGVSINNTSTPADSSAMLDIASTSKGILVPRMTAANRLAISSPATGLEVYQTDGTAGFYFYNGSIWQQVGSAAQPHRMIYSTAGTYKFTTSANSTINTVYTITLVGGGGGGAATGSSYNGGGGAGAYANFLITGLAPNTASDSIIVGTGGVGAVAGFFEGGNGTATYVYTGTGFVECGGGQGGMFNYGGNGGSAIVSNITGVLSYPGGIGGPGLQGLIAPGAGASTVYGSGGAYSFSTSGLGGPSGTGNGSGGSGSADNSIAGAGAGAPGLVIIEWSE